MEMTKICGVDLARKEAREILYRCYAGNRAATIRGHVQRGQTIAQKTFERFEALPRAWRCRHMIWFRDVVIVQNSASVQYDYYRTLRALLIAMRRWKNWSGHLHGSWSNPRGVKRPAGRGGRKIVEPTFVVVRVTTKSA